MSSVLLESRLLYNIGELEDAYGTAINLSPVSWYTIRNSGRRRSEKRCRAGERAVVVRFRASILNGVLPSGQCRTLRELMLAPRTTNGMARSPEHQTFLKQTIQG